MTVDLKESETRKGGLTLASTERTKVAEDDTSTQSAAILGLNEEEIAYGIQYACGPNMGNQQKSYKAAFPAVTDNYASSRSSELMKRERLVEYIKLITVTLMERLIVESRGVERLEDWVSDAMEAKSILRAARRRQIRLTSVESSNLQYTINRALGSPAIVADVTHRDETNTIAALNKFAQRVEAERRRVVGDPR